MAAYKQLRRTYEGESDQLKCGARMRRAIVDGHLAQEFGKLSRLHPRIVGLSMRSQNVARLDITRRIALDEAVRDAKRRI